MSKAFIFAAGLCLLAVSVFAGTVGTTCKDAIELEVDRLYEGDTSAFEATPIQCNTYKYSPQGIWYHYKNTDEEKAIILDTCDSRTMVDSVIFIFSSCDEEGGYINQCIAMDDDGCNQRQSRVMFTAEVDVDYHIFVAGFLNSTGIFYLSTSEVLPPDNFRCQDAHEVTTLPFSIEGETGTCRNTFDICQRRPRAGLWYKVAGTGTSMVAHTCNTNTNYDSFISVMDRCPTNWTFEGCVVHNNDACYRASMVQWASHAATIYYILVTGFNNARGRFTLAIEKRGLNPNSYCFEPIVITAIPFVYSGKTDYRNTTYSECRDTDGVHSVFFRVQGMNRKMIVTTCTSSSTVNDSVIDVYSQCEFDESKPHYGSGVACVASNDDYCGLGAQVVFFAASDSYYIAVSSASPTLEGVSYSLAVMPYEDINNTQCWYAKDIESFPDVMIGNTTHYDTCEQSCDGSKVERRGGWWHYEHVGASKTITVSTCNKFNALNASIEVYKDCNEMSCVVQAHPKDGCTKATFIAQNGVNYNIFITADDAKNPGGYFHADFYEEKSNEHGSCDKAWFVQRGDLPYRLEDDTIMSNESFSSCDNKTMRGVWVTVIGTGNKLVATTCDSHTGYDTVIELYNHCPDGSPEQRRYCMMVNDDNPSCGRSSEIEWASTSGQYYWIFVTGFADSAGVFVLNVYEKASMINAKCQNAVGIRNLPYYDYGLTTYCDVSNASCKRSARKGNWYEFVGNDHWITLSTCNIDTDFATEIEVYLACSEDGGEICVNHNHDTHCAPKTEITFAAVKNQLFYIFVTGVDDAVMSEGFFGLTVTQGGRLPKANSSSSEEGKVSFMKGVGYATLCLMGCGAVAAIGSVIYGMYKKKHLQYQEISTSG